MHFDRIFFFLWLGKIFKVANFFILSTYKTICFLADIWNIRAAILVSAIFNWDRTYWGLILSWTNPKQA